MPSSIRPSAGDQDLCRHGDSVGNVPARVKDRLDESWERMFLSKETIQELYEGIFARIVDTFPLDFYWFWTPEGWTWGGNSDEATYREREDDIYAAIAANKETRESHFGWRPVDGCLGPQNDRAFFDKILPLDVSVSCINRQVGMTPVEPGFADVKGRGKWAIPWMEDDPALTQPQLWAGRMRKDAVDAREVRMQRI